MIMRSTAFSAGGPIPSRYTCRGTSTSPPLNWQNAPPGTVALALIVSDPDAPNGVFIHWVIYNLPAKTTHLAPAVPKAASLPQGSEQGVNSFGKVGYDGPCPPPGSPHHYHFRLYALNVRLSLGPRASANAVRAAMRGHVLARYDLVGMFGI